MCNCVSVINLAESGSTNEREGGSLADLLVQVQSFMGRDSGIRSLSSVHAKDSSEVIFYLRRTDSPPIALRHLPSASNKAFQHGIFMYGSE
jgi:hypothetical protein